MHRHRLAVAAAVIALPFALTACSSGGTGNAFGQRSVQLNSSATSGAPASQTTASGPASGADSGSASGSTSAGRIASSAFCAAIAKAGADSSKMSSGDTSITNDTAMQDLEAALATAPAAIKGDMQTVVDATRTAIAKGEDINSDKSFVSPEADAAGNRVVDWASANCTFH